jgi:hypothetical protein
LSPRRFLPLWTDIFLRVMAGVPWRHSPNLQNSSRSDEHSAAKEGTGMTNEDRIARLEMRLTEARVTLATLTRIESELRSLSGSAVTRALLRSNASLAATARRRIASTEAELERRR